MVDFIRKRLQVFVSSTFKDLISERQAAVEAILTAGHIPAGMELFTSGDESQMTVIKQWIDESDIYLLILGGRYGSVEPTSNKSYTQLEYEYAVEESKPLFTCVINDAAQEKRVKELGSIVIETEHPVELKAFREIVLSRMVRFWDDTKDIKIAVGETLSHFARRDDLAGWVRPHNEANMPALVDEIARLSKENAKLRNELIAVRPEQQDSQGLSFLELSKLLTRNNLLSFFKEISKELLVSYFANSGGHTENLNKLCFYGLVANEGLRTFILTGAGKVYMNRLELFKIENPEAFSEMVNSDGETD